MGIRALAAAVAVAGTSLALFVPGAHAQPNVCVAVHAEVSGNPPVDFDGCLPPQ